MATRIRRTAEESRKTILEAAEYQVRKDGPDGFRLADIAERAGMHQSNLLHHFGSREALLGEMARTAFDRGAKRAIQAFGEAFSAPPADRVESLARVFDAVQQEGTGRLYAGLILSGRMKATDAPDFEPLVRTMQNWHRAMFGGETQGQTEEDARLLLLLSLIVWLGESVGGEVFSEALKLGDAEKAQRRFRRLLSEMIVGLLEGENAKH